MKFIFTLFFLSLISTLSVYAQESPLKIFPTDDAYVITDENDRSNQQGIDDIKTGDLKFLKIWNAFNVSPNQERIHTTGFLKFDISEIDRTKISKINLMLKTQRIDSAFGRSLELFWAPNSTWSELDLAYSNKPGLVIDPVGFTMVSQKNEWYSWDVTDYVIYNPGHQISFALTNRWTPDKTEESFVFYSKEADDQQNAPYLEIQYPIPQDTIIIQEENENDSILNIIIVGLPVALIGIGVLFYLIKQDKVRKQTISKSTLKSKNITKFGKRPSFVDVKKTPSYYINRYLTESKYKEWFDRNYPDYTIYEAVGVSESEYIRIKNELESK